MIAAIQVYYLISFDIILIQTTMVKIITELRNGWMVMSPKKTFCVYATTAREKIEWMTHISNCIDKLSSKIKSYFLNT